MGRLVLYTLEGCAACPTALNQLSGQISNGKVQHVHLSEQTDPDEVALKQAYEDGVDGFPTLLQYHDDGSRCELDPFSMEVVKCFR